LKSKAVSEVFGNLLILVIIAITISVMLSYGYPVIISGQENVKIRNVVSSMVFTKEKMDVVSTDVEPSAVLKFPPSGGELNVSNTCSVWVYVNGKSIDLPVNPGEILYTSGNRMIALELGGVLEKYGNKEWMIYPPKIKVFGNRIVVDIPVLIGSGSVGGYGIANIFLQYNSTEVRTYSGTIKLVIKTNFPQVWKNYFSKEGFTATSSGNIVTAETSGSVTIVVHRIDILIY